MLDNVDQLEFKQKNDNEMILRMTRERMDVIEKEGVFKEQSDNVLSVKIVKQDEGILYLKQVVKKHSSIQEVSSLSMEQELNNSLKDMNEK